MVTLTAEEMTEIARAQLTESLSIRLREATLLKIKTEGAFLNTGYQMCSYIVCTQEIGRDLAFQVGE